MRPPLNAGENFVRRHQHVRQHWPFDEAPAERGGKPRWHRPTRRRVRAFDEAPAERGGKLTREQQRRMMPSFLR